MIWAMRNFFTRVSRSQIRLQEKDSQFIWRYKRSSYIHSDDPVPGKTFGGDPGGGGLKQFTSWMKNIEILDSEGLLCKQCFTSWSED